MIVICIVYQGIAESKTGVGDEDVRNTAVNLVMVSQGPALFVQVNMHFTLLSLICISLCRML